MERITHEDYHNALEVIENYKRQAIADAKMRIAEQVRKIDAIIANAMILPTAQICDADVSVRLLNSLKALIYKKDNNINFHTVTLEWICTNLTEEELLSARGLGKTCLDELKICLSKAGLYLR